MESLDIELIGRFLLSVTSFDFLVSDKGARGSGRVAPQCGLVRGIVVRGGRVSVQQADLLRNRAWELDSCGHWQDCNLPLNLRWSSYIYASRF